MSTVGMPQVWVTEDGHYIPPKKVRRVQSAEEALSVAEESVYDLLWSLAVGKAEDSRLVQAGYDFIVKRTRLSRKTVQRVVDKLIDKDFLAIEVPADIYHRSATTYRVFGLRTVLERMRTQGREHVAKVGPGVVHVRPFLDPATTVAKRNTTTVYTTNTTTVVMSRVITQVLREYGPARAEAAAYLERQCRRFAPDCTEAEIIHFVQEKGALLRQPEDRVEDPVGFLLAAVPLCFRGKELAAYREEAKARRQQISGEFMAIRQWCEQVLTDPAAEEEDRHWARQFLASQGG